MKEFTVEKDLMNVNCVASVLAQVQILENMKEFTLERSLMSAKGVASVLTNWKI